MTAIYAFEADLVRLRGLYVGHAELTTTTGWQADDLDQQSDL
jgi:hypothetical protein